MLVMVLIYLAALDKGQGGWKAPIGRSLRAPIGALTTSTSTRTQKSLSRCFYHLRLFIWHVRPALFTRRDMKFNHEASSLFFTQSLFFYFLQLGAPKISLYRVSESSRFHKSRSSKAVSDHSWSHFAGYLGLLAFSHSIVLYLATSIRLYGGHVFNPMSLWLDGGWSVLVDDVKEHFVEAFVWYASFIAYEMLLALILPGVVVKGLALANGEHLVYNCNALAAWYVTLITVAALQLSGIWSISRLTDYYYSL
ncbi:C-24(28) sterol reductase, partial [Perkinsus olseni]